MIFPIVPTGSTTQYHRIFSTGKGYLQDSFSGFLYLLLYMRVILCILYNTDGLFLELQTKFADSHFFSFFFLKNMVYYKQSISDREVLLL